MVFYFTSNAAAAVYTIYMGKDKYENEELIKHGWPEDVWFHVDKLSSAHVYLRLHQEVLSDCAHLVKANSIQGCKLSSVTVVYTPWSNLRKTPDMDVGQIGFHRSKDVRVGMGMGINLGMKLGMWEWERDQIGFHRSKDVSQGNMGIRECGNETGNVGTGSDRLPPQQGRALGDGGAARGGAAAAPGAHARGALPGPGGRAGMPRPRGARPAPHGAAGAAAPAARGAPQEKGDGGAPECWECLVECGSGWSCRSSAGSSTRSSAGKRKWRSSGATRP
ncbi:coiled-coil domain-containing protein 25 isoform X3 [Passer domesticus]|uniref:coiled-coil domain-containing protein 25 isoform X3 n=1 Tax=Passer domesticus TaxID=48849 RepID=UPI0030FEB384